MEPVRARYELRRNQRQVMNILAMYETQNAGGVHEAWKVSHDAQKVFGGKAYSTYPSRLKELVDLGLVEVADKFGVSDHGTPGCNRYRLTADGIAWCRRNKLLEEESE